MRRFAVGVGLALVMGCGSPQGAAPINAPIAVSTVEAPKPIVVKKDVGPEPVTRTPSREIVRRFPLKDPVAVIYADFGGFTVTEVGRATGKQMAAAFKQTESAKCFAGVLAMKELAFGVEDHGGLVLARFDADHTADLESCLVAVESNYQPTNEIKNVKKAWSHGGSEVLVVDGNFVVFGTKELVERSLADNAPDEGILASMHVPADQYLMWTGHERNFDAHGGLVTNKDHLLVDADIDFQDEEDAKQMERRETPAVVAHEIGRYIERFDKGAWPTVNRIAHNVTMRREPEKHVTITYDMIGAPKEQGDDAGALGALGVRMLEHMLGERRVDAARDGIWAIQSELALHVSKQKKLTSLAPVPKTVPKGTTTKLADADWKAWSAIGYKREGATRFQFEVKANKAGDSAEIIARGDLNGDGKTSTFKLKVDVDPSGVLGGGYHIDETDPQE